MEINQYWIYEVSNVVIIVLGVLIILKTIDYIFFKNIKDN